MRTVVDIQANMITWAINRAGFELQDFLAKVPKVDDWIKGTKKPTVKQLAISSFKPIGSVIH